MRIALKTTILLFLFFTLLTLLLRNTKKDLTSPVLGEKTKSESVKVSGTIRVQKIDFKVYPEKRIPKKNNWSTIADFQVKDSSSGKLYLHQTSTTDKQGNGVIYPKPSEFIPAGLHSVWIKGFSHLAKRYDGIEFKYQYETYDFTPYGDLLAGDTHHSNDNFINSLDVSTLLLKLNTGDYKNDLNQDTQVNSLDLSNQLLNLSKSGDS